MTIKEQKNENRIEERSHANIQVPIKALKSNRTIRLGDSLKLLSVCCKALPGFPFFPASKEFDKVLSRSFPVPWGSF